jgi:hypothetical protein
MTNLPTFDEIRRNALRLLGDAADELRSDWRPGFGPNSAQATAKRLAFDAIGRAKTALDAAGAAANPTSRAYRLLASDLNEGD